MRIHAARGWLPTGERKPTFAHGAVYRFQTAPHLVATFHPSQQNTFTGRLTPAMMRAVFEECRRMINEKHPAPLRRARAAPNRTSR